MDAKALGRRETVDVSEYLREWNKVCEENHSTLPRVQQIKGNRLKMLQARIRESGAEAVREAITKAARSDFLNGGGGKGFVASFDWVMRPNNFQKVLEGNYDNRRNEQRYGTDGVPAAFKPAAKSDLFSQAAGIADEVKKFDERWSAERAGSETA